MPAKKPYRTPVKTRPDPTPRARAGAPDLSFAAAPAAGDRRRGGGPRAGGKGMRNMTGQAWDLAVRRQAK